MDLLHLRASIGVEVEVLVEITILLQNEKMEIVVTVIIMITVIADDMSNPRVKRVVRTFLTFPTLTRVRKL
jgi:ABC-type polysaccharide transport system permease subunit